MPGGQASSPWVWESADYAGRVIRITLTFNNGTRALTGGTVFRDATCQYTRLLIGLGADGTPDSSTKSWDPVPAGSTPVPVQQLANRGFTTIEDVLALQITAAPPPKPQ